MSAGPPRLPRGVTRSPRSRKPNTSTTKVSGINRDLLSVVPISRGRAAHTGKVNALKRRIHYLKRANAKWFGPAVESTQQKLATVLRAMARRPNSPTEFYRAFTRYSENKVMVLTNQSLILRLALRLFGKYLSLSPVARRRKKHDKAFGELLTENAEKMRELRLWKTHVSHCHTQQRNLEEGKPLNNSTYERDRLIIEELVKN